MNELLKNEPVKRVQVALSKFNKGINIKILENSARTAEDAAKALNCEVGAIVKSLILRKNDLFFLCLVSGDKRCSLNKLKKSSNVKDLSMADADKVKKITGFTIGGVSPVGSKINLETLIDQNLNRFQNLYAAAGHPNAIFKISFFDLQKITSGKIMDITE
tara:strand:+ start:105 stop:587 length:483 start_codon:yes stop_codon:yes gene_type:complete